MEVVKDDAVYWTIIQVKGDKMQQTWILEKSLGKTPNMSRRRGIQTKLDTMLTVPGYSMPPVVQSVGKAELWWTTK